MRDGLHIDGLVKRFTTESRGQVVAVNGLSLHVAPGEIYGLLGPNGAGKTTTLRITATLTEPDEGRVLVHGTDRIAHPLEARSKLAYVPAEAGLPERLSPREVVRLFARIQGVQKPEQRADAILEEMGAGSYADTPCADLSTGMKRRVVLARGLVHEPSVLLLDEPTDGLDVPGRRDVLALIRRQAETGRAVILSSHIMGEVEKVVDRLGVMTRGALVAEGTLAEVLAMAKTESLDDAFVSLIGEPL